MQVGDLSFARPVRTYAGPLGQWIVFEPSREESWAFPIAHLVAGCKQGDAMWFRFPFYWVKVEVEDRARPGSFEDLFRGAIRAFYWRSEHARIRVATPEAHISCKAISVIPIPTELTHL